MIFAAIDPGSVHAAIAVFHDATPVFVDDLRTANDMVDPTALAYALEDMKVQQVVVENVHAMPKQGVASMFKFGFGCGIIRGVTGALAAAGDARDPGGVEDVPRPQGVGQRTSAISRHPQMAGAQPALKPEKGRRSGGGPPDRRLVSCSLYSAHGAGSTLLTLEH